MRMSISFANRDLNQHRLHEIYSVGNAYLMVTCRSLAAIPLRHRAMIALFWKGVGPCAAYRRRSVVRGLPWYRSHPFGIRSLRTFLTRMLFGLTCCVCSSRDVNEPYLTHVSQDLARHMEQLMSVQIGNSIEYSCLRPVSYLPVIYAAGSR